MARVKSKLVIVLLESIVTKHQITLVKLRSLESLEVLRYDPMLQAPCIYKEVKKLASYKELRGSM